MPRKHFIHRDELLLQCGKMPVSIPSDTWEARKSKAASILAEEHALTQYPVLKSRAYRYDQAEVDKVVEKTVLKPIAA